MSATSPGWVAITGATGGLGRALARRYAQAGARLLLIGRNEARLQVLAAEVSALGPEVKTATLDQRAEAAGDELARLADALEISLFIANAGVKTGNSAGIEAPRQAARVIGVNLTGTIALTEAVLPAMQRRGRGQIAILSSVAAFSPSADLLSYSASKAGLSAYATGLRRALSGSGIDVSLILPGFIATPMTERHKGPAPFCVSADEMARVIHDGLRRRQRIIAHPKRLYWLARAAESLPTPLSDRIARSSRARIEPDGDERQG